MKDGVYHKTVSSTIYHASILTGKTDNNFIKDSPQNKTVSYIRHSTCFKIRAN